eukprot:COSAG06_NODE_66503_length_254_cov_0.670968_1_plen_50_part_10
MVEQDDDDDDDASVPWDMWTNQEDPLMTPADVWFGQFVSEEGGLTPYALN